MDKKIIIIFVLLILICALVIYYYVFPLYKFSIQQEAINSLAFIQARDRIVFYPVLTQNNQTILQSITWQELCQEIYGG